MKSLPDGLFQIVKSQARSDDRIVVGTAFAIQTPQAASQEYYLLTAYHNISEALAKQETILVRDASACCYPVEILYPDAYHPLSGNIPEDFALLKLISDKKYAKFSIGQVSEPMQCYIRGAALYFCDTTQFTTFRGEVFWSEPSSNTPEENILVLDISTKNVFNDGYAPVADQQRILKGMSGGPIIILQGKKPIAIGLFTRIYPDGSASKCYGIPMETIINKCLLSRGLYSIYKNPVDAQAWQADNSIDVLLYVDLLLENPTNFSLEDPSTEVRIWNKVSNQFYHGLAVDKAFYKTVASENFPKYSYDAQVAIRYYLARLLFKRGEKKAAYKQFTSISEVQKHLSGNVRQRVLTLIDARVAVESEVVNPQLQLDRIRLCTDKLSNLVMTDSIYIANELASVNGRGLTNLFDQLRMEDYSSSLKKAIAEVFDVHCQLLEQYPVQLQKQDVVNTSIRWLANLWGIWEKTDAEMLRKDAIQGSVQARKRQNAIFHIQAVAAYSISFLIEGSKKKALTGLFLSALLMRMENLKLTHEGINQLLRYVRINYFVEYLLITLFFEYCQENSERFFQEVSKYNDQISSATIGSAVMNAQYIFKAEYQSQGSDIFFSDIEKVIELL